MRETATTGAHGNVGGESTGSQASDQASGAEETTMREGAYRAGDADLEAGGHQDAESGQADEATAAGGGDAATFASGSGDGSRPTYTRPPGMVPPPDHLDPTLDVGDSDPDPDDGRYSSSALRLSNTGSFPTVSATAPVTDPARAGTMTAQPGGGVRMRPIDQSGAVGSARVQEAIRATRAASSGPRGPRRARLSVKRLDPWSVMKFSFAVSLVLFIVVIVAASVLYLALDTMGVFTTINNTLGDLVDAGGGEGFQVTAGGVIGTAAVLGAINVVLFTALATLGAFIYNVCADLVGGIEVTLAERD